MFRHTLPIALLITLLLTLLSFAQESDDVLKTMDNEKTKINQAISNYQNALKSENPGVTESAIINIMKLKYHYPEYDYLTLVDHLQNLERTGKTKSILFMSYIVKNYLLFPERYTWVGEMCCSQEKLFYAVMAEKIHKQVGE